MIIPSCMADMFAVWRDREEIGLLTQLLLATATALSLSSAALLVAGALLAAVLLAGLALIIRAILGRPR